MPKRRHSRCTNARSQERRASASGGGVTDSQQSHRDTDGRSQSRAGGGRWRSNPFATGSAYHGWLTPAAPGCTTFVRSEKRHSRCTNARFQERRASARRGFRNRICKCNPMNFGVSCLYAECVPRGAYAPRSSAPVQRASAGRMTIFAMNKRTFARAAGVSPPWFAKRDYAGTATFTGNATESGGRQPAVVGDLTG